MILAHVNYIQSTNNSIFYCIAVAAQFLYLDDFLHRICFLLPKCMCPGILGYTTYLNGVPYIYLPFVLEIIAERSFRKIFPDGDLGIASVNLIPPANCL